MLQLVIERRNQATEVLSRGVYFRISVNILKNISLRLLSTIYNYDLFVVKTESFRRVSTIPRVTDYSDNDCWIYALPFSYDLDDLGQRVTASHLRYVCIHSSLVQVHSSRGSLVQVHSSRSLLGNKSPCPFKENRNKSCVRQSFLWMFQKKRFHKRLSLTWFCLLLIFNNAHIISNYNSHNASRTWSTVSLFYV